MYESVYLLAGAVTSVISLTAIWAARSEAHWFWRGAAVLSCFVLLVPVGAAELALLLAPVGAILFLASGAQHWWRHRAQRRQSAGVGQEAQSLPDSGASSAIGANQPPPRSLRITLRELFLVTLQAAIAAWVVSCIVQEGVMMDLWKLPIAVLLVTAVVWASFQWIERPLPWRPAYAKPPAYALGLVAAIWSMYAMIYWLAWESALDIVCGAASLGCLVMVGIYAWLVCQGGLLRMVLLLAAIYVAAYVHATYLGDWLSADHLLVEAAPTFWLVQRIVYGLIYVHVAAFVVLGVLLWRGLALPRRDSWGNWLISRSCVALLAAALIPLAWLYWRLQAGPEIPEAQPRIEAGQLAAANEVLRRIEQAHRGGWRASLEDTPKMRQLVRELVAVLAQANAVPTNALTPNDTSAFDRTGEQTRLTNMAAQALLAGQTWTGQKPDEESEFLLALIQYSVVVRRECPAGDAKGAYWPEQECHMRLGMLHDDLSVARRRELLRVMNELDRTREPLDALLARDAAWSDRHERWRSRLRTVVLGKENSVDTNAFDTVRERHNACVAVARLNMTNIAIRLFETDESRLPSDLQELVPAYLDDVPIDPYTGEPLIYRPQGDRFALYSLGSDQQDSGGVPVLDISFEECVAGTKKRIARSQALAKAAAPPAKTLVPTQPAEKSDPDDCR